MRRLLVAGNWKMNGSRALTRQLAGAVATGVGAKPNLDVLLCPPYVYLAEAAQALSGSAVALGAQDVAAEKSGAFTGEVSAGMLADVGCRYVIVGHSERRALYGESDDIVAAKFRAVLDGGLIPILCIGESLAEHEAGDTHEVVARQLRAVLEASGVAAFGQAVVAYEPVWAIGTGKTATPGHAQDVHAYIRAQISAHDAKLAGSLRILYGGSVKASNAAELFSMPDVDGGLVGGASLEAAEFLGICAAGAG